MIGYGCLPVLMAFIGLGLTAFGVFTATQDGPTEQPGPHLHSVGVPIAAAGIVLMIVMALIGHTYRCIGCDTRR